MLHSYSYSQFDCVTDRVTDCVTLTVRLSDRLRDFEWRDEKGRFQIPGMDGKKNLLSCTNMEHLLAPAVTAVFCKIAWRWLWDYVTDYDWYCDSDSGCSPHSITLSRK